MAAARASSRSWSVARAFLLGLAGVVALIAIWELYKLLGPAEGVVIGAIEGESGSGVLVLPRTHDRAMPHTWDMVGRLFEPTSGGSTPPLFVSVISAALVTLGIAAVGWRHRCRRRRGARPASCSAGASSSGACCPGSS